MAIDFTQDQKEFKKEQTKDMYKDYCVDIGGTPTAEQKLIVDLLRRTAMLEKRIEVLEKKSKLK